MVADGYVDGEGDVGGEVDGVADDGGHHHVGEEVELLAEDYHHADQADHHLRWREEGLRVGWRHSGLGVGSAASLLAC